ncbi:hypothetical protein DPMN_017386 [Dreissena polymorpha]|uniref:Uncharacterized protein n=1 Tax=Dreissena polymorpha TaxID=45954 RepID=A0A9D4NBA3_DREPO|nr:hypothetical protein DPMN_017386 [Dreissena polymorpha]
MEQQNADGGEWILWFTRIYVILFVVVFAVFAISLLIAIFLSAHKTIGKQQKKENKNKGTNERDNDALNRKETLKDFMEITLGEQLWVWRCLSFTKCSRCSASVNTVPHKSGEGVHEARM